MPKKGTIRSGRCSGIEPMRRSFKVGSNGLSDMNGSRLIVCSSDSIEVILACALPRVIIVLIISSDTPILLVPEYIPPLAVFSPFLGS